MKDLKYKIISLINEEDILDTSWGSIVQRLRKDDYNLQFEQVTAWVKTKLPEEAAVLEKNDRLKLIAGLDLSSIISLNTHSWNSYNLGGRVKHALGALLCILSKRNLTQQETQNLFVFLVNYDLTKNQIRNLTSLIQKGINYRSNVACHSIIIDNNRDLNFDNYTDFYESVFDRVFLDTVPKSEWKKYGIIDAKYLSLKAQAPLLLMLISKYNPAKAISLVETAFCITSSCGRGSSNREIAALSIPFLHITDEQRVKLIKTAFQLADLRVFQEYFKSLKAIHNHFMTFTYYLSLQTLEYLVQPDKALLRWINEQLLKEGQKSPDLLKQIKTQVNFQSLNLMGLFKLYFMLQIRSRHNASQLILDSTINVESLNSERWFGVRNDGPGMDLTVLDIKAQ